MKFVMLFWGLNLTIEWQHWVVDEFVQMAQGR